MAKQCPELVEGLEYKGSVSSILENVPFLGGITEIQRTVIFDYFETASFEAREFVARKGETPTRIDIN